MTTNTDKRYQALITDYLQLNRQYREAIRRPVTQWNHSLCAELSEKIACASSALQAFRRQQEHTVILAKKPVYAQ